MSINTDADTGKLRQLLHAQLERHTAELTALTTAGTDPQGAGEDPHTIAERAAAARRAIADTNAALTRLADGTYGRCERCVGAIPVARLEILPHARLCVPCQSRSR
ncbi:TraR/DksA C4-type zinc finger protein [Dactylosporangium roseum]|uniref:TraR/DksA C4-type zinc finger protein n=1 Tax=Dactylosporangium roseum TaxID=47989 RepID=A0ABY5YWY9_9ACTN|nr:TraR/DksA family transcriptional regulator [Dactylosporangium roseum]UWZ34271.1 TraR/DksA C4-type zinc finger protein [Dactylosporangium roseum]